MRLGEFDVLGFQPGLTRSVPRAVKPLPVEEYPAYYDQLGRPLVWEGAQGFGRAHTEPSDPIATDTFWVRVSIGASPSALSAELDWKLHRAHSQPPAWEAPGFAGQNGSASWSWVDPAKPFSWRVVWQRGPFLAELVGSNSFRPRLFESAQQAAPITEADLENIRDTAYTLDARIEAYLLWGTRIEPATLVYDDKTRPVAFRRAGDGFEVALDQALWCLGGKVDVATEDELRFTIGDRTVVAKLGERSATVAGQIVALSVPVTRYEHGITVPLQLLAEATGKTIALQQRDGTRLALARPAGEPG